MQIQNFFQSHLDQKFQLKGSDLKVEDLFDLVYCRIDIELAPEARERMQLSRSYIQNRIEAGDVMYGVNTGFGAFSSVTISKEQITDLQKNLIRSHSVGVGTPFTPQQTKAMMILRANALARGHSGIRPQVVEKILEFLKHEIFPVIPSQGSVGASGDLAPLSHLALSLIGEGEAWSTDGKTQLSVQEVLKQKGLQPLELQAKEGLSLINDCQVMTALGLLGLYEARRLSVLADFVGSLSLETLRGSRLAFDPLIAETRPHPGEKKTAGNLRTFLSPTSQIAESHKNCHRVQDAYSLRCMPAVHGAVKDALAHVTQVLEIEANTSTDNPLVFEKDNKILSCGNFHGMPVAFAMDYAAIALCGLASISEARISKLINPAMSDLPAFLAVKGGLQSGMMIVQVAAASLVSENKVLAHPASCDTIPTSADKEDHVSMGTIAARKFISILENTKNVLAMELLCAAQGLDLLRPLQSSSLIERLMKAYRQQVSFAQDDRYFAKDIEKSRQFLFSKEMNEIILSAKGDLQC